MQKYTCDPAGIGAILDATAMPGTGKGVANERPSVGGGRAPCEEVLGGEFAKSTKRAYSVLAIPRLPSWKGGFRGLFCYLEDERKFIAVMEGLL